MLQIIDNVSKVLGRHTLKTGINFQHVRFYGLQPPNGKGTQSFSGTYTSDPSQSTSPGVNTGAGLADFLLDYMNSSNLSSTTPFTDLRWYYSAFIQDDIQVTPCLTINAGIRWEYTQPIRKRNNLQANFYATSPAANNGGTGVYLVLSSQRNYPLSPRFFSYLAADNITLQYTDNNYLVSSKPIKFAPRVGFNYRLTDRSVFRVGYGLFYGGLENIGLGLNLANNALFFVNDSFIPSPNTCNNVLGAVTCPTNGQTLESGFWCCSERSHSAGECSGRWYRLRERPECQVQLHRGLQRIAAAIRDKYALVHHQLPRQPEQAPPLQL